MSINIMMPNIGAGTNQGKIIQWLKAPGDSVRIGEIIAEIETDKAIVELEALDNGTFESILISAGAEDVPVGSVIATLIGNEKNQVAKLLSTAAEPDALKPTQPTIDARSSKGDELVAASANYVRGADAEVPAETSSSTNIVSRSFASPSARRLALELEVDLSTLNGSGPNGRIVHIDIERASRREMPPVSVSRVTQSLPMSNGAGRTPHTAMRRAIARRLTDSKQNIPHFYLKTTCDVLDLGTVRQALNAKLAATGTSEKISINDLVVFAVSRALANLPEMNVQWNEDWIEQLTTVDISIAVSIEAGLITPIIRNANSKSLREISREIRSLAATAKLGRLQPAQFVGGSFTISNLGMYGVDEFAGIINPPQCAILAVGRVAERLRLNDGTVQSIPAMTLTLSADHRVIDGALAARFLQEVKQLIESPATMLL